MNHDHTFRIILILGLLVVLPIGIYHRLKSQATGEKLDRWQEGLFILFTLRTAGVVGWLGIIAYLVNPSWMAWSSVPLPEWLRWTGVGVFVMAGGLLIWTFRSLGKNLTDTVVTRREHTLVTSGPSIAVRMRVTSVMRPRITQRRTVSKGHTQELYPSHSENRNRSVTLNYSSVLDKRKSLMANVMTFRLASKVRGFPPAPARRLASPERSRRLSYFPTRTIAPRFAHLFSLTRRIPAWMI